MGATTFYHRGEADEATSLDLVVEAWIGGIYEATKALMASLRSTPEEEI